jgi:prepilin-type N-terminal cleavage/methylation domain-containing protein
MPSFRRAFTLAEILVAVAILAIVSSVSLTAIGKLSSNASEESIRKKVQSSISDLDRQVRDGTIGSYEAAFRAGDPGFFVVTDASGLSASGSLSGYDWNSGSGTLRLGSTTSGPWTVRLARNSKMFQTFSLVGSGISIPISFPLGRYDELSASIIFDSEPKNRLSLRPFDPANGVSEEPGKLTLSTIRSGATEYSDFTVRNVLGKKEFDVSGTSVGAVTLVFSKGGKELSIEFRK